MPRKAGKAKCQKYNLVIDLYGPNTFDGLECVEEKKGLLGMRNLELYRWEDVVQVVFRALLTETACDPDADNMRRAMEMVDEITPYGRK